jgi:hypothetical protein
MGMAAALKTVRISSNPDHSGSFGKGFNWIVHQKMKSLGLNTNYFKHNSPSPNVVVTGSAWGTHLNSNTIRLIALAKRGASGLTFTNPHLWLRSIESLRGSEIKKDLKHKRVGILSQIEVDYITAKYPNIQQDYDNFANELRGADVAWCQTLEDRIKALNRAAKPAEILANTVVQRRIQAALPENKKLRDKALKRPIKESIDAMGGEAYIKAFNPAEIATSQPFSVSLDLFPESATQEQVRNDLCAQYATAVRIISDESYRQKCINWFAATIAAKLNL